MKTYWNDEAIDIFGYLELSFLIDFISKLLPRNCYKNIFNKIIYLRFCIMFTKEDFNTISTICNGHIIIYIAASVLSKKKIFLLKNLRSKGNLRKLNWEPVWQRGMNTYCYSITFFEYQCSQYYINVSNNTSMFPILHQCFQYPETQKKLVKVNAFNSKSIKRRKMK